MKQKDGYGKIPLHYALENQNPSANVIYLLLEEWPDAIKEKDEHGKIPLHHALENHNPSRESENVIYLLLTKKKWPDAMKKKDGYGKIPLHYALENQNPSANVIYLLLEEWPDA